MNNYQPVNSQLLRFCRLMSIKTNNLVPNPWAQAEAKQHLPKDIGCERSREFQKRLRRIMRHCLRVSKCPIRSESTDSKHMEVRENRPSLIFNPEQTKPVYNCNHEIVFGIWRKCAQSKWVLSLVGDILHHGVGIHQKSGTQTLDLTVRQILASMATFERTP